MTTGSYRRNANAGLVLVVFTALVTVAVAGYVDLYGDVDFNNKLRRVEDVVPDVCYTLRCPNGQKSPYNDVITSARWHDLTETSSYFTDEDARINFYLDHICKGSSGVWKVKTQSKKNLYFPANFRLDSINDAVSSFKVISTGGNAGMLYICSLHESSTATNSTANSGSCINASAGNL